MTTTNGTHLPAGAADLRPRRSLSAIERMCTQCVKCVRGNIRYFDALAIVESLVSIISGIIVWMGLWDLLGDHIVPDSIGAKSAVVIVGLVAVYGNRTLYDKELLRSRAQERERRRVPGSGSESAAQPAAAEVELPAVSSTSPSAHPAGPPAMAEVRVDIRGEYAAPAASEPPRVVSWHAGADTAAILRHQSRSWIGTAMTGKPLPAHNGALPEHHAPDAHHHAAMRRLYFDAPPFKLRSFLRASFALLAGLTLWIGIWDLLDYHLIHLLFPCCRRPDWPCAFVKAALVILGLLGLYSTRSLYGEDTVKSAHFQRMT